ncbi:putative RNA recognition motif domain, nucleotide-binding alpha-beta plait domain superfamily [Helianthus anomalus]
MTAVKRLGFRSSSGKLPVARRPPGYAIVDFDDKHDAQDAIRELDAQDAICERDWFIMEVTKRDLEKHLSAEGKVEDVPLVIDQWTREFCGFGFVYMSSSKVASL